MTRYFIYRTDRKVFMGEAAIGPQWRKNPVYGAYATWDDPAIARRVAARLREQGYNCDVETVEV